MSEVQATPADLLAEMVDADDSIRRETREFLWWNSIVLLAAILLPSVVLGVCGILILAAVWALRHHQVPWAGGILVVALCALVLYGAWAIIRQPSTKAWIDLAVLLLLAWQLVSATLAAVRYRQLSTTYRQHFGARR